MEPYLMLRGGTNEQNPGVIVSEGLRLAMPEGMVRIKVDLPRGVLLRLQGDGGESVACCGYSAEGDSVSLRKPDDPMAGQRPPPGQTPRLSR